MKTDTKYSPTVSSSWTRFFGAMLALALMVSAVAVSQTAPVLGTANSFGILAAGAITGGTTATGNVGTSTLDAIAGTILAPGYTVYAPGNGTVVTAHNDFITAYTNALANNPGGTSLAASFPVVNVGNDASHPLLADIYSITTPAAMGADLFLSGSSSAIFIFKTSSTFNTTAGTIVHLAGGLVRNNIYWLIAGAVNLGAGSSVFEGTILCNDAMTVGATAIVHGALLGNGAITVNAASVLPVELVSFTATSNRMNADLRWSTATEVNNYGFEVERRQSADWSKVGFVAGAGTSNSPRDYSYTDNNLSSGRYTYRLKQVDNNGAFSYHGSVEVVITETATTSFALSQNYPNPFNPSTQIQYSLEKTAQVSLKVYNVLGNEVATLVNGRQEAGSYTVPFNSNKVTPSLSSGVYLYRLEAGSFVSTKRLILMK